MSAIAGDTGGFVARRREGFLVLLTEVPWWVSVVIAAIVYVGMRWIAPSIEFNNQMLKSSGAAMPQAAWVFGLFFLFPALVSFLKRKQRQKLLDSRSMRDLPWREFELLIGEAFSRRIRSVGGSGQFDNYAIMQARPQGSPHI